MNTTAWRVPWGSGIKFGHAILGLVAALEIVFLISPILVVIPAAFSDTLYAAFPPKGLTAKWFATAFSHSEFRRSIGVSVLVALASSSISVALGLAAAGTFARSVFPGRTIMLAAVTAPAYTPTIIIGVALMGIYIRGRILGTLLGIILAHAVLSIPFVFRILIGAYSGVPRTLEEAAYTLGAGRMATLYRVTLPLLGKGILAACVFSFIISFEEAVVSLFITSAGNPTFAVKLLSYVTDRFDPLACAFGTIYIATCAVLLGIVEGLGGLRSMAGGLKG